MQRQQSLESRETYLQPSETARKTGDRTINHETVDTRANHMCVSYLDLIQTKQLKENYDNFLDLQKSEY